MTRQAHFHPTTSAGAGRSVAPGVRRHSPDTEALLALQRSVGNASLSRMIGGASVEPVVQRAPVMPGSWDDSWNDDDIELDEVAPAQQEQTVPSPVMTNEDAAAAIRARLESESEVTVDPAAIALPASRAATPEPAVAPSPPAPVEETAVPPGSPVEEVAPPGSPVGVLPASIETAVDPATVALPDSRATTPEPATVAEPERRGRLRQVFDGDKAKMAGAAAAIAGPGAGLANNANPSFGLMAGATGGASLTAFGDAMSEVVKAVRSPDGYRVMNWGKLVGGVLAFGGLVVAAPSIAAHVPGGRAAGMAAQGAGLLIKSYGEGYRLEKGSTAFSTLPDGDIAKAAGNFVAAVAPILQSAAYFKEPALATMLTSDALAAGTVGSSLLKAALYFTVGSGAGDFASEIVKGVKEGRVNPGKAIGGLLHASGAFTFANGAVLQNVRARTGGLYLQAFGLAAKSAGEGIKMEETALNAWPSRRKPAPAGEHAV
ncbi:hypothetical protein [Actinoplanes utahensis]|uniref:Uncharacterized protein n=1 Tax=Actinoplanes utahensis TaxID=1869 RepID=A0A0A6UU96_ACTUT|nr:hypothetical protein [Actinoplanes utahensis]KHD78956.1 hypothetical protein MB27_02405 [Actinoplanes utahensis]GIF28065.1 hypothetical protein Aut01nite_10510 [Actinoplanes utahensis]